MERRRGVGGVLLAAAIVAGAACGSDGDSSEATSAPATAGTASEPAAEDGNEPVEPDATDPAAEDENDDTSATGDSGSTWCEEVRAAAASDEPSPIDFDVFGLTPAEIEAQLEASVETIERWARSAPSEIEGDVATIAGAFRTFIDLGREANWDFNAMASDPAFAETFDSPELTAATDAVDDYNREVCGVDLVPDVGDAGVPTIPAPEEGDIVAEFLAGFGLPATFLTDDQRACMNAQLSTAFPDGLGTDFVLDEQLIGVFDEAAQNCGVT